jgi:hypothetical protein
MSVRPTIAIVWAVLVAAAGAMARADHPATASRLAGQFRAEISELSWTAASAHPQTDDLDLSAMAKAALNYLHGNPDPQRNYECKFSLGPLGIPCHVPMIAPNRWGFDPVSLGDTDCRMDMQYAHMRAMAGLASPDPVELGVKARVRSYQHDDGLCWINPGAYIGRPIDGEWIGTWTTAKLLYSLAEEYQRTGDAALRERARKTFLALRGLALWDGPRAYYPGIAPYKDGQWLRDGWCEQHARNYPFVVEPCVRYWEATGDREALDFAKAVTEGFLAGSQKDQGRQAIDPQTGAFQGHVHLHTHAVWGVAHLGAVIHEPRYLDWAQKAYEFVIGRGTDFGWYPEFVPQGEYRTEICVVGDMVSLGAWLARGGRPQYWDHVERTVRNELRRSQFVLTPAFVELFRKLHQDQPPESVDRALAELRKLEGGFVAQATFDDWVSYPGKPKLGAAGLYNNGIHMMGCCPPEGMRGLWEAFGGVVEESEGVVRINMALSRDHPTARVTASRPLDGRIDVTAKKAGRYQLRPPAWSDHATVRLLRNGQPTPLVWDGPAKAYVVCADVHAGERFTLTWSVPHFVQTFSAQSVPKRNQKVVVRWTGNEVVAVDPRGRYLPMFTH